MVSIRSSIMRAGPAAAAIALIVAGVAGIARGAAAVNPPVATTPPSVAGQPVQGATLQATTGTWTGAQPMTFTYQWRRCGRAGGNCANIGGATAAAYVVTAQDVGRTLRVRVTARNADGSASAVSAPTPLVAGGPAGQMPLADGKISIPVASVALPQRLLISEVSSDPRVVRSRQPFTVRFRVTDTRGYVVRDALVYATGVPYNRVQSIGEQATGQDGWVSFTVRPTAQLPLRKGFALTMFVRARKAGDNLLAGVSTRRLVQVRLGAPQ